MSGISLLALGALSATLKVGVIRSQASQGANIIRVTFTATVSGGSGAYAYSWNEVSQGVVSTASTYSYTYNFSTGSDPGYSGTLTVTSGAQTASASFG